MTPSQQKFLVESTQRLVDENGEKWVVENRARLQEELELVFKEV